VRSKQAVRLPGPLRPGSRVVRPISLSHGPCCEKPDGLARYGALRAALARSPARSKQTALRNHTALELPVALRKWPGEEPARSKRTTRTGHGGICPPSRGIPQDRALRCGCSLLAVTLMSGEVVVWRLQDDRTVDLQERLLVLVGLNVAILHLPDTLLGRRKYLREDRIEHEARAAALAGAVPSSAPSLEEVLISS
jgi:hypothetical protein